MMTERAMRCAIGLGIIAAGGAGAAFVACSSGQSLNGAGGEVQTACVSPDALHILYSPGYSAFDGVHTFQVPAIVDGLSGSIVSWSVSDPSLVSFQPDPATGGIMLTTLAAGRVTISAQAGGLCGSAVLNITHASPNDWEIGNARYNNGMALHLVNGRLPDREDDAGQASSSGGGPACTNCHGETAMSGPFKDIAHTPEQTGGFSDQEIIDIAIKGTVPDGGYFDPSIISYHRWQEIHTWTDITPDEQQGMVVYLRSLTPAPQMGSANWGGRHRDGGMGGGPGMMMDAGGPGRSGAPDGGVPSGSGVDAG